MPGNPEQCRLYATRCLKLAERANNPARRDNLIALAETWTKLAAEYEADQPLLNTLSEINVDEAFYAVPEALKIRPSSQRAPSPNFE